MKDHGLATVSSIPATRRKAVITKQQSDQQYDNDVLVYGFISRPHLEKVIKELLFSAWSIETIAWFPLNHQLIFRWRILSQIKSNEFFLRKGE